MCAVTCYHTRAVLRAGHPYSPHPLRPLTGCPKTPPSHAGEYAPLTRPHLEQPPSVLEGSSAPPLIFRLPPSRTNFLHSCNSHRLRPRPQPASPPANWLTCATPQHSRAGGDNSALRGLIRVDESIRLTPITWPNEIAFQLRNLETAPPIRPSGRPATTDPHRSPNSPHARSRHCDNSTNSPSPSRPKALLVATHGVLGDCVDIIVPSPLSSPPFLLVAATQRKLGAPPAPPGFSPLATTAKPTP